MAKKKDKKAKVLIASNHQISGKIKFSFEYYDTSSTKYCISNWNKAQIFNTLKRLKEISEMKFIELTGSRVLHFKQVIWEKTIMKSGFHDNRVNKLAAFHFALLNVNGQKARVFGAYSEGTFYIVWFDLEHNIWPTFKKHT